MAGMTKLITSSSLPEGLHCHFEVMEDPGRFVKAASAFGGAELPMPDDDHVGLHLVALGDVERYGFNRNGDGFPKKACQEYHPTFVKNGHVYEHHKNKDPKKALGSIKMSAYNEPQARIELFIHAHKEKAASHLDKMEKSGEVPFSMACRVQYDRCNACNATRKNAKDPNMCDHVRYELGKVAEDGTVYGVHNDEPKFFDISFVYRPADRIAWDLKKVASDGTIDSVELAKEAGIWTPEELAVDSPSVLTKLEDLRKLAEAEQEIFRVANADYRQQRRSLAWQMCKAASTPFSNSQIENLRRFEVPDTMSALARANVILDPISFCKYAMGTDLSELAPFVDEIEQAAAGMFSRLMKEARAVDVCSDGYYDVDASLVDQCPSALRSAVFAMKSSASFGEKDASARAVASTINGIEPELVKNAADQPVNSFSQVANCVIEKYASYKLAALSAVRHFHPEDNNTCRELLAAAQNMIQVPKL